LIADEILHLSQQAAAKIGTNKNLAAIVNRKQRKEMQTPVHTQDSIFQRSLSICQALRDFLYRTPAPTMMIGCWSLRHQPCWISWAGNGSIMMIIEWLLEN
jgi:hypothetical protein